MSENMPSCLRAPPDVGHEHDGTRSRVRARRHESTFSPRPIPSTPDEAEVHRAEHHGPTVDEGPASDDGLRADRSCRWRSPAVRVGLGRRELERIARVEVASISSNESSSASVSIRCGAVRSKWKPHDGRRAAFRRAHPRDDAACSCRTWPTRHRASRLRGACPSPVRRACSASSRVPRTSLRSTCCGAVLTFDIGRSYYTRDVPPRHRRAKAPEGARGPFVPWWLVLEREVLFAVEDGDGPIDPVVAERDRG